MTSSSKLLLFLLVALGGISFWYFLRPTSYGRALGTREVATRGLGEELARRYPGTKALIVSNPFAEKGGRHRELQAVEEAGIRGLKQGFGEKVTVGAVAYPVIRPEAVDNPRAVYIPDTTTPLSYLMAEDAFDQLAQEHADCELLVSLIGLPAKLSKVEFWSREGPPRLALLLPDLRRVGGRQGLRQAMQSGKLVAFVLPKPGGPPEQAPVTGDYEAEFQRRYVLVTEANVDEVMERYPALFDLPPGSGAAPH